MVWLIVASLSRTVPRFDDVMRLACLHPMPRPAIKTTFARFSNRGDHRFEPTVLAEGGKGEKFLSSIDRRKCVCARLFLQLVLGDAHPSPRAVAKGKLTLMTGK